MSTTQSNISCNHPQPTIMVTAQFIKYIKTIATNALATYYSKESPMSIPDRYRGASMAFETILHHCNTDDAFRLSAVKYWNQRSIHDATLGTIQTSIEQRCLALLSDVPECVVVRPIGSFTGRTHVADQSDLDFVGCSSVMLILFLSDLSC